MKLFFELLRIAIGTQSELSGVPTASEWKRLYSLAEKQSLLGVCFAGIQKLQTSDIYDDTIPEEREAYWTMPEALYLRWMSDAANIQQRNGVLVEKCGELQSVLEKAGFASCVLKGQSLVPYYGELGQLRQSGDIDIWLNVGVEDMIRLAGTFDAEYKVTVNHVECKCADGVKVELHPTAAFLRCPWLNRRLQKWIAGFDIAGFDRYEGFRVVPVEFNLVYLLVHIYYHLLTEGIGLRHYTDYYFVLRCPEAQALKSRTCKVLSRLGMTKFARGVMWMMQEVFGMPASELLMEPDAAAGQLLLDEALQGGNFGHHDTRNRMVRSKSAMGRAWGGIVRNMRFFGLAPWIVICSPFWRMWHWIWRSVRGYR